MKIFFESPAFIPLLALASAFVLASIGGPVIAIVLITIL